MVKIFSKIFSCAVVILLWFNIRNITILFHLSAKNYILLAGLVVSAVLPYILKKNILIPLGATLAITVAMCIYESAYLVWAAPMLCVLYAYKISRDESKSIRHKTRLHIIEILIVGFLAAVIPIAMKFKTATSETVFDNFKMIVKMIIPVFLVYILLSAVAFYTAYFRKAQHKEKQTAKLLSTVFMTALICCLVESVFYRLIHYFLYCDFKFILLPWIILLCVIMINDDPNIKFITDKIDLAFDKFSKLDLEKK